MCLCVSLSINICNNEPLYLQCVGGRGQAKKTRKKDFLQRRISQECKYGVIAVSSELVCTKELR